MVMDLVPSVIWLGKTLGGRYQDVSQIGELTTEAAGVAIESEEYGLALEWLEEGRSIIWNQILQLRTPVDDLRQADAALADRLEFVASALDQGSDGRTGNPSAVSSTEAEDAAQLKHRMAEEWASLLEKIRSIPQFHNFLMPRRFAELKRATRLGAVVIINVQVKRCDALVLLPENENVVHIPLPSFSQQQAAEMKSQWARYLRTSHIRERGFKISTVKPTEISPKFGSVLAALWSDVVQPILNKIGYAKLRPEMQHLPHVTWCCTGPLAFLPLHAAGHYNSDKTQHKIFDYVVSSYTPSLGALLATPPDPAPFRGILAVGQAATPGKSPLPGTVEELNRIQQQVVGVRFTRLEGESATVSAVLSAMDEYSWIHLACHASQNLDEPTRSAFYLHDGSLDLATISSKPLVHTELAFLSACQTAAGDENLSEEAVHLAAGMLMSGYPSVIATMWSIKDEHAPIIAGKVYASLVRGGIADSCNAAKALHEAVGYLRNEIGEDQFESWVPFIHIGL